MSPQDKIASMAAALGQRGNHDGSDDNFSDDESTPLTQDIYGGSTRTVQETKGWDVFRDLPPKTDSGSMANQNCLDITVKILKVVAYLVTFIIVLGSGVVAKGSLLLMTSQLRAKRVVPFCNARFNRGNSYVVELPDEERVAWIWMLLLAFAVPELGTLFRSVRICFFKSWRRPPFLDFALVFLMETFHAAGTGLLVFAIMPEMDVVKGAMLTNSLCIVPGVLGMLSRTNKEGQRFVKVLVDLGAIVAQCTGLVVWPLLQPGNATLWTIPVAVLCISCGWWENYVNKQSPIGFIKTLGRVKERLKRTRYFTYMFISVWKIIVMFTMMLLVVLFKYGNVSHLFNLLPKALSEHQITVSEVKILGTNTPVDLLSELNPTGDTEFENSAHKFALYTCMVQVFAAYICYIFGKFACKIMIQGFSYAFPVSLTVPVTISLVIAACGLRKDDPCYFGSFMPHYIFFESPPLDLLNQFVFQQHAWIWLLWLLSQTWITLHIWTPKCERLATTEKLFVTPMYQGLLIDQSMAMNRRRDDEADVKTEDLTELEKGVDEYYETISIHTDASGSTPGKSVKSSDYITRIYACCTMWHETKEEMMEMLKSILRMDEDQCARRVAQKYLRVVDPDYYEFETHIFFDDAFEISDVNDDWSVCNRFVKLLVTIMDEAASHVHETNIRMRPPKKYPTPYGGRLEWILPGKTKMIAHLKDKSKIRHRKRWSQVMYMYYLLGHRLMELPISVDRKEVMAENTFLLTLDGDIDFQPHAVQLLIDLMKKNRNLGAACGRIHPVGSGPMVWYQMFEYAIGHWLQKATEHMIGCVLCSPGCFSLFRGKSLMDDNVMRKYTTRSDEARHYVQYDQGEDRWLCTLLLQRGYRVEYSAASDAYTHCPEGFNEFYNQRRRWVPSTIANIMDLLVDAKKTIKINDNISMPYIAYQMMLMGGTILGPGTIFLMLVGAFVAAFKIDNWTSFYYNIIPIMFFMLVCFTCKANIQLAIAQLLTLFYAMVMLAVLVGVLLEMAEDGAYSPSSLFFYAIAASFVLTALLHPMELLTVFCGLLYYSLVPSMYLLMVVYAIFNLNNVTWGTREVATKKTRKELEEERKEAEEAKRKARQKSLLGFLQNVNSGGADGDEGGIEISLAGLFKCIFCTHPKSVDDKAQLVRIAESLDSLGKRLQTIEVAVDPQGQHGGRRRTASAGSRDHHLGSLAEDPSAEDQLNDSDSDTATTEGKQRRDDLVDPFWIEDRDLKRGEVDFISTTEMQFWKDLLAKYLYPIDDDKNERARIAHDLKELRDKSVFAFFMVNAIFVLIVFLLQLNKDLLHVKWPLGVKTNITYDETTQEVLISKEYLQLEPIGLVFVFFFALILVIQFTAMLFHRFGTLSHILASAELTLWNKKVEDLSQDALLDKHAVDIVRNLQRLRGIDGDYDNDSGSSADRVGHRRTIHNLEKQRQKKRTIGTLDVAFKKRFFNMKEGGAAPGTPVLGRKLTMRQETIKALETRRNSVMAERKKSHMQTLGAAHEYGVTAGTALSSGGTLVGGSVLGGGLGVATRNHRNSVASMNVKDLFDGVHGGQVNRAYEPAGYEAGGVVSEDEMDVVPGNGSAIRMHNVRNNVSWREQADAHPRSNSRM